MQALSNTVAFSTVFQRNSAVDLIEGIPRSESRGQCGSEWTGETDCRWVWHWAMHARNNRKAVTQLVCCHTATNPEFYWQRAVYLPLNDHLSHSRNKLQALITGGSLPRPAEYLLPTKLQGSSNVFQDTMHAAYTNDPCRLQERVRQRGGKQSGSIQLENDQQLWLILTTA